jgi:hypothetical protein
MDRVAPRARSIAGRLPSFIQLPLPLALCSDLSDHCAVDGKRTSSRLAQRPVGPLWFDRPTNVPYFVFPPWPAMDDDYAGTVDHILCCRDGH